MARATGADLLAAKQRRKKKIAIGGAVLLVALLAVQVPRTMKMLRPPSAPSAEQAPAGGAETRPPAATTSAVVTLPPADSTLAQAGSPGTGQLVAFTRFTRKDPFRPQIREDAGAGVSHAPAERPVAKTKPEGEGKRPVAKTKPEGKGKRPPGEAPATEGKARLKVVPGRDGAGSQAPIGTTAVISINGEREEVKIGTAFPASEKVFVLASLGTGGAKIGIAGGSLIGDSKTVLLRRGKMLTLENTVSGARYKLRLLSVS